MPINSSCCLSDCMWSNVKSWPKGTRHKEQVTRNGIKTSSKNNFSNQSKINLEIKKKFFSSMMQQPCEGRSDNHVARWTKHWRSWPGKSPDLNPIGSLWSSLRKSVEKQEAVIKSKHWLGKNELLSLKILSRSNFKF